MKTDVFVIYGGRSAEHDVSLITAQTVIQALDTSRYHILPIYITIDGVWQCQGELTTGKKEGSASQSQGATGSATDGTCEVTIEQLKMTASATGENPALTKAQSLAQIIQEYWSTDRPQIMFPVIHGPYGEDGTLQGLLEMLDIPFVGNSVLASAAGMDKVTMKYLLADLEINQASFRCLQLSEWMGKEAKVIAELQCFPGFPCYVKPANMGSSIGISRCENETQLLSAITEAFRYDHKLLIEEEIVAREVQFAVLGNEEPQCSVGGEFVREQDFFDYEKKYKNGKLVKQIPAHLSPSVEQQLRESALQIFKRLGGSGLMRIDFFVTADNRCYFNEVNTLPGFTLNSMFPALWEATDGTGYGELLDKLIELAWQRHNHKQSLRLIKEERL